MVELLIVMAIVAFLAAIGWPAYQNYTTASRRTSCQAGLVTLAAAMERHFTANSTYATAAAAACRGATGTVLRAGRACAQTTSHR